ncbi:MAG: hypothetical protein A3E78_05955 [Alphaproteobacteria bacterium RIFCSPHIGHO2_12_FULL_63_12]|nr:MAG: hypothetical protein A3E78_05955 [Alphaproteobacteria bacterium RIFCSPHIGHO2_12_FULL_63_12]
MNVQLPDARFFFVSGFPDAVKFRGSAQLCRCDVISLALNCSDSKSKINFRGSLPFPIASV